MEFKTTKCYKKEHIREENIFKVAWPVVLQSGLVYFIVLIHNRSVERATVSFKNALWMSMRNYAYKGSDRNI